MGLLISLELMYIDMPNIKTPSNPNSLPPKGNTAASPFNPIIGSDISNTDPQAAQPIPNTPLKRPNNPVPITFVLTVLLFIL